MPKKVKKTFIPLPDGVTVGELVRYYSNGWRTGHLEEVSGNDAGVRSVGTYLHGPTRLKWVSVTDLEAVSKKGQK